MKNLILAVLATTLLISCSNNKKVNLKPNDMFWHKFGYGASKWIVVDTLDKGIIAYSEKWLPSAAMFVSYSDLVSSDEFKVTGKYEPVKDSIEVVKTIDINIYPSIVQKVSVKSIIDGTYYINTQVWCDNKQQTALSLEYWEQETVTKDMIESVKKSEYAKAERVKLRVERKLKENR